MMSRKHYMFIASAIKEAFGDSNPDQLDPLEFVERLCKNFKRDNPNFDTAKFLEACDMKD